MAFTHLHVHTEYSLLDGAARIKDLIARTKELGMDSVAITDHGVMFGVIDFYKEAKKQGVKPIIGCEVYTAARTRHDKTAESDKRQGHLVLLAKDMTGYKNLMKIVSEGFTEGFYYKPRIDRETLRKYNGGLIALSACLAGDVQSRLLMNDYEGAKAVALEFLDIFGEGNFYLELQDQDLAEERQIKPYMLRLREETGIPLVATNDVHYVRKEDATAHDVLLCIQTAANVDDPERMRFANDQFYLKSEDEMRKLFADVPEAIDNTARIADACNVELEFGKLHLPEFEAPDGRDNKEYLRALCTEGLARRYPEGGEGLAERLEYELSVIEQMGYVEYFLIVWDFINYARTHDVTVGPGRGSAAGSIVAYCLGITDIDPIKYGLIFERFLNPERVSMPDIDIDFCDEKRQQVIDYVTEKYGHDHVAQIITFGTLKAKAAVRDVGRALNVSYAETDAIAKAIPFDLKMTIDKALEVNPELKQKYDTDPTVKRVLDTSRSLEGLARHASTHAAGIVISREPINEYVPLYMADKGVSTQFTMTTIEELGLLKMDFLGLKTLTVIRDALDMVKENHGIDIDFRNMEYDDPEAFRIIADGNTMGIFQLESTGLTQFMKNLRPDCFEDIIAGIALYRPGPMKSIPKYIENKKRPAAIVYPHEKLEPILSVTYGCLVYQEQVMRIVRDLAGYSYGRSDLVRRAMSKKKRDVMEEEKRYFIYGRDNPDGTVDVPGCVRNGIPEAVAKRVFDDMDSFAEYAFNKSHAAAYAVLAYETAYLKRYYPAEFMAALMSSVSGDASSIAKYIRNCRDMGVEVLPPDVNESEKKFTAKDGRIRFGLLAVKNVGEGVIDAITAAREEKGKARDIFEFFANVNIHDINKKAIESLIRAGAFDSMKGNRAQQIAVYEMLMDSAQSESRKNLAGQLSLFQTEKSEMEGIGAGRTLPDVEEFDAASLMSMEKETLGVYLTHSPLDDYENAIRSVQTVTSDDIERAEQSGAIKDGTEVVVCGIVTHMRTLITKAGRMMAFLDVEDLLGRMNIIVFSGTYERDAAVIREDAVVAIKGRISFKEDETPSVIADRVILLEPGSTGDPERKAARGAEAPQRVVKLRLPDDIRPESIVPFLKEHKGETPVIIYYSGKAIRAGEDMRVLADSAFCAAGEALLGKGNVKIDTIGAKRSEGRS